MRGFFVASAGLALGAIGAAQGIGPQTYVQFSDSPWAATPFEYFHLEDFEDDLLNTPGASAVAGAPYGPSGITDSVDADDGTIDGSGTAGHSFFIGSGATGLTFNFDDSVLGALPTHAGIVWTDGFGVIEFEAFDASGNSLGVLTGNHADASIQGTTGEDRFYGWVHSAGISKIRIGNSSGGIEVDHLQYGAVPEPATMVALGIGALALLRRRNARS